MARFAVDDLDQEERAFVESVEGLHRTIEALKIVYGSGRFRTALDSMQEINACLVAAALKSKR
jgi:hypothetical protein